MSDEWTKATDDAAQGLLYEVGELPSTREPWADEYREAFRAGADFGRAYELKRTANLERDFETESEAHTFYKQEWELACERYNSLKLDHEDAEIRCASLKAKLQSAVLALELYATTNDTFPEYGNVARAVLQKLKGEGE